MGYQENPAGCANRVAANVGALLSALVMLLSGCASVGDVGNPVARKLTWFSYLNGDDLRAGCVPGAPARFRFVHNGVYIEQVRTYDIETGPVGSDNHVLRYRVVGPTNVGTLFVHEPLDVFAPGRGDLGEVRLADRDMDDLDGALAAGGFFDPAPKGLALASEDFYWLASACVGGRFVFNAYRWSGPRYENARFPDLLLAWDRSGVPLNPPRRTSVEELVFGGPKDVSDEALSFNLKVGENGLVGVAPLFC